MNTSNSPVIINTLTDFQETEKPRKSLLEQINSASSEMEIKELLKTGASYKNASVKTLKMWAKAAAKKSEQFKST